MNPINPETGEILDPVSIAAETMLGDLMALVVDELKALPRPWQQLAQVDQSIVIGRAEARCRAAVGACTRLIASRNFPSVGATVESVTFKGGVKAVLTMHKSDGAHQLADEEGGTVRIVFASAEEFAGTKTAPKAEPDQRDFIDGNATREELVLLPSADEEGDE